MIVALGRLLRLAVSDTLWQVVVGTTVDGIGTGVGYAAISSLINAHTPPHEIAASGLNALFRSLGSALASAIGGILAANTVILTGLAVPSLAAYHEPFALCAAASVLCALVVLLIPHRRTA